MKRVDVIRRESGELLVGSVAWCSSTLCRLRGIQFRRRLDPLLLVHADESVVQSSIHMFFVFFPIAAIWIDGMGRITSAQLAKPWRPWGNRTSSMSMRKRSVGRSLDTAVPVRSRR